MKTMKVILMEILIKVLSK